MSDGSSSKRGLPVAEAATGVALACAASGTATLPGAKWQETYRPIWRLAMPAMAEQLVATFSQLIDMVMVGWLGAGAVVAVGLSSLPFWVLMSVFLGLGVGGGVIVARSTGAGDDALVEETTRKTVLMATVLAGLATWLLFYFAEPIVVWLQAEPELVPQAAAFLRLMAPGMGAVAWALMATAAMRAGGDTHTPAILTTGVIVINVIGNYLLIYGHLGLPALGLNGVGYATSGARLLGVVGLAAVLLYRRTGVRVDGLKLLNLAAEFRSLVRGDWIQAVRRFRESIVWRALRLGLPASLERGGSVMAVMVYARQVASLGTAAFAAHHLVVIAESVVYLVSVGLATAAAALVGQRLGAGAPDAADRLGMATVKVGLLVGGVCALLFLLFPHRYLSLFISDPEVLALGVVALRVAALGEIPMAVSVVFLGALQGAGERAAPVIITGVGAWVVRLTLTVLLIPVLGLAGAWLAAGLDWLVRMLLAWWRFRHGAWQRVHV